MSAKPWWLLAVVTLALSGCTEEKIPEYAASGTVPYSPPEQIREREPLPCDERAIVLLVVPGRGLGNGFVFGDGSLVATAYHVIRNASGPLVLSRYWGDVFAAKIVVSEATRDLAVLQVSWPGHPALELATRKESLGTREVMGGALISPGHKHDTIGAFRLETERLWVRVGDPEQMPWVQSGRVERMGRGWSGCPLVLAESGRAVGLFTALGPKREAHAAPACRLRALANTSLQEHLLNAPTRPLPERPADAEAAFAVAARLAQACCEKNDRATLGIAAEFLSMRPRSSIARALYDRAAQRLRSEEPTEMEALPSKPGA